MSKVLVDRELLERCADRWACCAIFETPGAEQAWLELRAVVKTAQPAEAEGVGHDTIVCWNCGQKVTLEARDDEDGFCPHCMCELDLSDYLINANAALSAVTAERDRLRAFMERVEKHAEYWWDDPYAEVVVGIVQEWRETKAAAMDAKEG